MSECKPLQISLMSDDTVIIDLQTIFNRDDISMLLDNVGKDVYISSVSIVEDNKITLRLIRAK